VLDGGLVLWFPAPNSETGEDMAELQVHGGRAVVAGVLAAAGKIQGCRLAEPGEFARRAFENGKLDLTGVEGLADLIDAETAAQRRQALRQADGALAALYGGWRKRLIEAMALLEAAIDFSDEGDVARDAEAMSRAEILTLRDAIARHLDDGHRGELVRDGFQVVLAGPELPASRACSMRWRGAMWRSSPRGRHDPRHHRGEARSRGLADRGQRYGRHPRGDRQGRAGRHPAAPAAGPAGRPGGVAVDATAGQAARVRMPDGGVDKLVVLSKADLVDAARAAHVSGAIAVSARTGQGIDVLTGLLADAARARIGADERRH
jgi:tRNA modification GTPase